MIKLKNILNEIISQAELNGIEGYLDKLFAAAGIDIEFTRHFLDRANDARNRKQIEPEELEDMFMKAYEDHGEAIPELGANAEAVLVDMESDINIPFVLKHDPKSKKLQLISKTVMRKSNFRTSNKRLTV